MRTSQFRAFDFLSLDEATRVFHDLSRISGKCRAGRDDNKRLVVLIVTCHHPFDTTHYCSGSSSSCSRGLNSAGSPGGNDKSCTAMASILREKASELFDPTLQVLQDLGRPGRQSRHDRAHPSSDPAPCASVRSGSCETMSRRRFPRGTARAVPQVGAPCEQLPRRAAPANSC